MKKLLILFIAMLLCCLAMTALAEDEHQHEWVWEHTNEECWQVCRICKQEGSHGEHAAYTCTGEPMDTCHYCGMTEAEGVVIKKYNHAYRGSEWYTSDTMHFRMCVFCSEYIEGEAHADTCMYPGVCKKCGAKTSDGYIMSSTDHITVQGGNILYDQKKHWRLCPYCAETFDYGEHTCICTNPGVCETCGAKEEDGIEFAVYYHYWKEYNYDTQEHWHTCLDCGNEYYREKHQASCANPGVCAECGVKAADGYQFSEVFVHDFDWDHPLHDKTHHWYLCKDCGAESEHWDHEIQCTAGSCDHCAYCDATSAAGDTITIMHDFDWDHPVYDKTYHWYVCKDCGAETEHWVHAVSCTAPSHDFCANCPAKAADGDTITIWHNVLNDQWLYDEETHWMFCPDCGNKVNLHAHEFNRENVCEVCGYKKAEQPASVTYTLAHVAYDGQTISGQLTLSGGAAITPKTQIRVTFYLEGNIYMGTYCELDENGEFSAEGVGLIRYITVIALEEEDGAVKKLDAAELFI